MEINSTKTTHSYQSKVLINFAVTPKQIIPTVTDCLFTIKML